MRIAVAGATGVVGRHVVDTARRQGHEVVPLARSAGVDLVTGEGLDLTGAEAVVDCVGVATQRRAEAVRFFETTSRRLLEAGARAGVRHHVLLSIVGIDDPGLAGLGYYAGKRAQEHVAEQGGVPWSLLRATQFHEFAEQALAAVALGPVSLVPTMTSQPVAAVEVARALVDLAVGAPVGRAPDLAGPARESVVAMARAVARRSGRARVVLPLPVPGPTGRALRGGALCLQQGRVAGPSFDAWLATR